MSITVAKRRMVSDTSKSRMSLLMLSLTVSAAALCLPSVALANEADAEQEATPSNSSARPPAEVSGSGMGGEIVVTARRRSESLQDVPLSVSAFGTQQLETQNAGNLRDLQHSIPSLQYSERGVLQTELTIRGVGGDSRNIGIDSGVGMYIDGVYIPRTSGFNSDLAEVAQLEVLRGPQGTLFGKNTIGGVVNITTKKPTEELEGMVYASYGNYNAMRIRGALSAPITDKLFAKVTVSTWDRDGYVFNTVDKLDYMNENRRGARLQLRYLASDRLEINVNADVTKDRTRTLQSQPGSPAGAAAPYFTGNRYQISADHDNIADRDMWGASITADYTLENDMKLTYIGAHREIDIFVKSDIDQLPIDVFHSEKFTDTVNMESHELRLVSPGTGSLRYVAGLYYYNQDGGAERRIFINNNALAVVNFFQAKTESYAGYLNVDYDILPGLTATGGVRYTYEKKKGSLFQERPGLNYNYNDLKRSDKNISWTGSLAYKISPDLTTYATVSRGFKSGGFNLEGPGLPNIPASALTFGPEKVTSYEVGLKGRLFDAIRFSLSGFHLIYKDKQVVQLVPAGPIVNIQVTNAGAARMNGVEAEVSFSPFQGFDLSGNFSHLDTKYTSFPNAATVNGGLVSFTGNRVERAPKYTASGQAVYRFNAGPGTVQISGSASYTGDTHLQPDNSPATFQKGYLQFDGRVSYELPNGLTLAVWGKNLANKDYAIFQRFFAGLNQVTYGEPRTYGVEARYRF